ncbi:MAG: response regulator transcription factor [Pseudomonadota bacterium]
MRKTTLLYGALLALGAFLVHWLEQQYALSLFSTETYVVILAALFTGLGIWLGTHLNRRALRQESGANGFTQNTRAIRSLGISPREIEVLELLAQGSSNQEIAGKLFVSVSTVKTHLVHLYQKLQVARRTQAIQKARELGIIQ